MSAYPTPSFTPLLSCPVSLVLDNLMRVLMHGVPSLGLPSAAWDDPATGAPAGHFFLPPGTRIYRADLPDTVDRNCITIHADKDCTRVVENDPRYWLIPVEVQVLWKRQLVGEEMDLLLRWIEQFLSVGFRDGEGILHEARHYLSETDLHVFEVRDIVSGPLKQSDGWGTALLISMVFFCAGKESV